MAHCAEAKRVLAELDSERQHAAKQAGRTLNWDAADNVTLAAIAATINRKVKLTRDWTDSDSVLARVKVSAELRALEASLIKLIQQIMSSIVVPAPKSRTSQKAMDAANARWDAERARNG